MVAPGAAAPRFLAQVAGEFRLLISAILETGVEVIFWSGEIGAAQLVDGVDISCEELLGVGFDQHALVLGVVSLFILEPFLVVHTVVAQVLLDIYFQVGLELIMEEPVLEALISVNSFVRVGLEHFFEEVNSILIGGFELFELKINFAEFIGLHDILAVGSVEWLLAGQNQVEDNSS